MRANYARIIIILMVCPVDQLAAHLAWRVLLDDNGLINQFLGLWHTAAAALYTQGAVIMGLMYDFLPFMILPIYTALQKLTRAAGSFQRPGRKPPARSRR